MAFVPHLSLSPSLGALSLPFRNIGALPIPSAFSLPTTNTCLSLSDDTVSPSEIDTISLIFLCFMKYISCDRTHMLQGKFFFHTDSVLGSP
uniref:Uncharacterized protein n=1 Tax=Saimiri boliviensis boliviensis TaxID=39432 RepID=A0A2K6SBM6_SAIBB